jgi:16S rRNA (guanine527-N7)-methyltransferase
MGRLERQLLDRFGDEVVAERFAGYLRLLESWSKTHNLVRFTDREELLNRHLLEPLPLAEKLNREGLLLDIGSGAGLPGIPILIARPGWRGVLLEPRQKRWAFLRMVVRELGLQAEVIDQRFEEFEGPEKFNLVTARAVGRHEELAEWVRPRLATGGSLALWVGQRDEAVLRRLSGWHVLSSPVLGLDQARLLLLEPCFT